MAVECSTTEMKRERQTKRKKKKSVSLERVGDIVIITLLVITG